MVTIYDIAERTGYSVTTVSKAFNHYTDISDKTRRDILKAAKEMGYLPNANARALTTKKSWTIGVLFAEVLDIGIRHPFFNAIIESFKTEIETRGYDLLFITRDIGGEQISYLDHCRMRGVDGVIIVCIDYHEREVEELLNSNIPCVMIDLEEHKKAITVSSDNIMGSSIAVEYLYSIGHRRIAHIAGAQHSYCGSKRIEGYKASMKKLGLHQRDDYIIDGGYFTFEGGYRAMKKLLSLNEPPTAVFVAGDLMAVGAIRAVQDKNLNVPSDISVIGFDDIDLARYINPSLTTIKQDTELMGKVAADLLTDYILGDIDKTSIVLPVELMVRESSAPL